MPSESYVSPPPPASPSRRPLQNLTTNLHITPHKLASSSKAVNSSPVKPGTPLTPALLLSTKKTEPRPAPVPLLNPAKKRTIDEVIGDERDPTRVSFSLINFDQSSDNMEPASSAATTLPDDSSVKMVRYPNT
ncbi:hypothetical protein BT63DRAFT_425517 [Microthyrium microscopicum]|uniref:Uncharacterized protein n=1 Tax=Microthyrium microscopicum TaxID=703497 RepID=A0A6A6U9A8_9PEZI|nr:hypothetical protein BT63DRAFT_425517 [Microthyrium microscopicum]